MLAIVWLRITCFVFVRYSACSFLSACFPARPGSVCRIFAGRNRSIRCLIVPSRWARYKLVSPCRSQWTSTQCPPSCIPLVRGRTCDDWRIAAASRWWSWCRAARNCWTVREQETGMRMSYSFLFFPSHFIFAPSWRFREFSCPVSKDFIRTPMSTIYCENARGFVRGKILELNNLNKENESLHQDIFISRYFCFLIFSAINLLSTKLVFGIRRQIRCRYFYTYI